MQFGELMSTFTGNPSMSQHESNSHCSLSSRSLGPEAAHMCQAFDTAATIVFIHLFAWRAIAILLRILSRILSLIRAVRDYR